ncbi:MAG TPA: hypothetical protein VFZ61_04850 [Polyangiales bacterium]
MAMVPVALCSCPTVTSVSVMASCLGAPEAGAPGAAAPLGVPCGDSDLLQLAASSGTLSASAMD